MTHSPGGPVLHARMQEHEIVYHAPFAQSGTIVGMDDSYVHVRVGHTVIHFALADLSGAFSDPADAVRIFANAAFHQDHVEIHITPERVTYDNPSQFARVPKPEPAA